MPGFCFRLGFELPEGVYREAARDISAWQITETQVAVDGAISMSIFGDSGYVAVV